MTKEKILERLMSYEETRSVKDLSKLLEDLKEDVRHDMAASKNTPGKATMVKRLLKSLSPELRGYIPFGDQFVFTDMYLVFVCNDNYAYPETTIKVNRDVINFSQPYTEFSLNRGDVAVRALEFSRGCMKSVMQFELPSGRTAYYSPELIKKAMQFTKGDKLMIFGAMLPAAIMGDDGEYAIIFPRRPPRDSNQTFNV